MLNRQRSKQIFLLTMPILGGMVSQNILNLVDAAMVGSLGTAALAAVGISGFINFLAVALFIGLATGVQAFVGRNMGQGRQHVAAYPLNSGLLINLIFAIPLSIILIFLVPTILSSLLSDPKVIAAGIPYLQARMAGITAMGMNFCFRGFWSAIGRPGTYLRTLLVMHAFNILLNYILIFGHFGAPALGTFGAGLGTAIALSIGSVYYAITAWLKAREYGFARGLPSRKSVVSLLKISLPAAIQQMFFAAGFTALFWIIGKVGTDELAGANAIVTLTLVAILPCIAFGITANSLVSKALGAGQLAEAYRWGWDTAKVAVMVVLMIGLPMVLFPHIILSVFLHDAHALSISVIPLQLVGAGISIDAVMLVLISSLQGAGASRQTMVVSMTMQWLVFLPVAYLLGPVMGMSLTAIWLAQLAYRAIQLVWVILLWQSRRWQRIRVHTH